MKSKCKVLKMSSDESVKKGYVIKALNERYVIKVDIEGHVTIGIKFYKGFLIQKYAILRKNEITRDIKRKQVKLINLR